MRLKPGISLQYAEDALRNAVNVWSNARGARDFFPAYTDAVEMTFPPLECAFAAPDLASGLRSSAYWYLLQLGSPEAFSPGYEDSDPAELPDYEVASIRARNGALSAEIERQQRVMERALVELAALKRTSHLDGRVGSAGDDRGAAGAG
ncbi:hypothetical protein ACIRVF_42735 [Kitasatospora sp. NPDC101157]|uniref:hypothetical protein n=1 Tax=Kitasatospora sp. NPDC101157 TaxID=3364098 RepID=UPI00382C9332